MKNGRCRRKRTSGFTRLPTQSHKTKPPYSAAQGDNLATRLQQQLDTLPIEALARSSGFRRRKPKKLAPALFVQAACLLVTLGSVSYRRWAGLIGLLGQCTLSKQALFERLSAKAVSFLQSVLGALLAKLAMTRSSEPDSLRHFGRVLLQDSTTLKLSEKLARFFPGPSKQRGARPGMLKIQACYDLLSQSFVHFSLSSFRHNDQAASPELLPLLQTGDLIIRDLGYFVLEVLAQIAAAGAYFLSRLRLGVSLWEVDGRTPVNLLARLRKSGHPVVGPNGGADLWPALAHRNDLQGLEKPLCFDSSAHRFQNPSRSVDLRQADFYLTVPSLLLATVSGRSPRPAVAESAQGGGGGSKLSVGFGVEPVGRGSRTGLERIAQYALWL